MKKSISPIIWVILAFTIINFIQAIFTELDPDEAYYWMYSKELAWGYFDHPPVVALMIHFSGLIFKGELGVRLLTVLLQSLLIYILWLLAEKPEDRKDVLLLCVLFAAMPMFTIYGFVTTPDPPLLFFTALFFLAYRHFLKDSTWVNTLLLGLTMTLMLYSKYHGVLIILFTLGSNLQLLKNIKFYIASVFGALLFVPHLYWQFANEFPSLKYHLVGRNDPYELKHTLNYLVNQVINFSPLLFPLWLIMLNKIKVKDLLHRAFLFCIIGFWLFFLVLTIKGHAEPQWTAVLCIPIGLLGYALLKTNDRLRRIFFPLALFSLSLLLIARVIIMLDFSKSFLPQFHKKEWIQALDEKAGNLPVLFLDNYRDPSTYSFYSGKATAALNFPLGYRRNQFDIWDWEKSFHGKEVLLFSVPEWETCPGIEPFKVGRKNRKTCQAGPIQIVQKLEFTIEDLPETLKIGATFPLKLKIKNPYPHDINFDDQQWPIQLRMVFINGDQHPDVEINHKLATIKGEEEVVVTGHLNLGQSIEPGDYQAAILLIGDNILFSINSDYHAVEVITN